MGQRSFFWNGVTVGDANTWCVATADGVGYHMSNATVVSPWVDIVMRMLLNGTGNRGVLLGWLNALAVTGATSPVSVNTGGAVIYGLCYENDAAVTVTIPLAPVTYLDVLLVSAEEYQAHLDRQAAAAPIYTLTATAFPEQLAADGGSLATLNACLMHTDGSPAPGVPLMAEIISGEGELIIEETATDSSGQWQGRLGAGPVRDRSPC